MSITEQQIFNTLKFDLSIRTDNTHCGSGLGGNTFELFFLMFYNSKVSLMQNATKDFLWSKNANGQPELSLNEKVLPTIKLRTLREALTQFIDAEYSDFKGKHSSLTQEELTNPAKLDQLKQGSYSDDLQMLAQCATSFINLKNSLVDKYANDKTAVDQTDIDLFLQTEKLPDHIRFFAWRKIIGIDMLSIFCLDEMPPFSNFFNYINKTLG